MTLIHYPSIPLSGFVLNSRCGVYQIYFSSSEMEDLHWICGHLTREDAMYTAERVQVSIGIHKLTDLEVLLAQWRSGKKLSVIVGLPDWQLTQVRQELQVRRAACIAANTAYEAVCKECGRLSAEANYQASQTREQEIATACKAGTYDSRETLKIENRHDQRMWKAEKVLQARINVAWERVRRAYSLLNEEHACAQEERPEQLSLWGA